MDLDYGNPEPMLITFLMGHLVIWGQAIGGEVGLVGGWVAMDHNVVLELEGDGIVSNLGGCGSGSVCGATLVERRRQVGG